ncbi:hypothetical protein ACN469_11975 [Corallococcus terminator]
MSTRADMIKNYYQARHSPTTDLKTLELWWGIEMSPTYYSPFLVRFVDRSSKLVGPAPKDALSFQFVRDTGDLLKPLGNFVVDLKDEPKEVWPHPPSTIPAKQDIDAVKPTEKLYGFLFLSTEWQETTQKKVDSLSIKLSISTLAEGGGKWPIAAALEEDEYLRLRTFIDTLRDAKKRDLLRDSLRHAFGR